MFIKRIAAGSRANVHLVLLVEGVREALKRPPAAAKDAPVKTRVVHRTLANLSRLPSR